MDGNLINLKVTDEELDTIIDALGVFMHEYTENPQVYERFKGSAKVASNLSAQFRLVRNLRHGFSTGKWTLIIFAFL